MNLNSAIPTYLTGHLLIAMPQMEDQRFQRSVIYICAHNSDGAMGLVVNRLFDQLTFPDLLEQLNIEVGARTKQIRVHFGGPVEAGRGFVLHSDDYVRDGTMVVTSGFALTATIDILKAIALGEGPQLSILALGYAGWGPGQLDAELAQSAWLTLPVELDLIFEIPAAASWEMAIRRLGADPHLLQMGHGVH